MFLCSIFLVVSLICLQYRLQAQRPCHSHCCCMPLISSVSSGSRQTNVAIVTESNADDGLAEPDDYDVDTVMLTRFAVTSAGPIHAACCLFAPSVFTSQPSTYYTGRRSRPGRPSKTLHSFSNAWITSVVADPRSSGTGEVLPTRQWTAAYYLMIFWSALVLIASYIGQLMRLASNW